MANFKSYLIAETIKTNFIQLGGVVFILILPAIAYPFYLSYFGLNDYVLMEMKTTKIPFFHAWFFLDFWHSIPSTIFLFLTCIYLRNNDFSANAWLYYKIFKVNKAYCVLARLITLGVAFTIGTTIIFLFYIIHAFFLFFLYNIELTLIITLDNIYIFLLSIILFIPALILTLSFSLLIRNTYLLLIFMTLVAIASNTFLAYFNLGHLVPYILTDSILDPKQYNNLELSRFNFLVWVSQLVIAFAILLFSTYYIRNKV